MSRRHNPYQSDHRTRQAKGGGYPARSVFKLEEIDRRCGILQPGQTVVDLGAAPGSWSLYAARKIGADGKLLALDLKEMTETFPANVQVLQADALHLDSAVHQAHAPYDVVLSDMAPNTTSDKFANAARSYDLFMAALGIAQHHGASGSCFVGKLFMGEDFAEAKRAVSCMYLRHKVIKPAGTRSNSVEVFLVGIDKDVPTDSG